MREVFQFLSKNGLPKLTEFYQHKVDQKTFDSLRTRAEAFEFSGQSINCKLIPDLTFDLGTMRLNSQLFLSVIDVNKSKAFTALMSRKLGYAATEDNTGACLVVQRTFAYQLSKKIGKPAWQYEDFLVVVRLDGKHLVSQHVVTATKLRSVVAPQFGSRKAPDVIKWFNSAVPDDTQLIRGLNGSTIVWNGNKWGTAEFVSEGNLMIGGREIGVGRHGNFKEMDLGRPFRVAMGSPFGEFEDDGTGFVIPGPTPQPNSPGARDWFMQTDTNIHQTVRGGGNYGGGAGGGSGVETGTTYSGSATCSAQYNSLDNCYACCDNQGGQILAAGIATTTAITAAAGTATLPGGPLAIIAVIVVAVIGVGGSLAIAWVATDACKSACNNTFASSGGGGGATRDEQGNYIT
jgi:hypothetical protein